MTDEQQQTIVDEALRIFCEYLNRWWNEDEVVKGEPRSPYKPENFTTYDPERDLYGQMHWDVLEEPNMKLAWPTGLIKIYADDGDEGGGNQLYVGLQGHFDELRVEIEWMVQIFDLQPSMIWTSQEGYRSPPNGKMKK
jgi:hypothetical protein